MKRILIFSHYLGSLKYFDKLYDELVSNNCEVIYGFWYDNKYAIEMIKYCRNNNKNFYRLNYQGDLFIKRMFYKLSVKNMLEKLKPDMIIQQNDMHFYQNEIVHQAKIRKIPTLAIQWAFTAPEDAYTNSKQNNQIFNGKTNQIKYVIKQNILSINKVINKLSSLDYKNKLSIAQGGSNRVAVVNKYSKDLLIKQGVKKNKIIVTGHLDFDNAVANIPKNEIENSKYLKILFISQPFYTKDLKRITIDEQIDYIKKIYLAFDKELNNFKFYLKLHPAEKIESYSSLNKLPNLIVKENFDNEISINVSNLVISSHSSLLMSAVVAKKPILTLNILKIKETKNALKVMKIDDNIINSWDELNEFLKLYKQNPKQFIRKINHDFLITDGLCKKRTIDLILGMIHNGN